MALLSGQTLPMNTTRAVFLWHKSVGGFCCGCEGAEGVGEQGSGCGRVGTVGDKTSEKLGRLRLTQPQITEFDPLHPQLFYSLVSGCAFSTFEEVLTRKMLINK